MGVGGKIGLRSGQTRMRVQKREFEREFSQLSCAGQTRELMRVDHAGCHSKLYIFKACKY